MTAGNVSPLAASKNPQTSKGVRRRSLIVKVAARLFAERGFDRVSIADIGQAAGVTGPAVYRYFPGKEALLVAALEHLYRRAAEGFGAVLSEPISEHMMLERLIDLEIQLVTEEPEKIRLADSEGRHLPEAEAAELHRQNREHLNVWTSLLRTVRPDLDRKQIDATVHALLAMLNSASRRRSDEPLPRSVQDHLREMAHHMIFHASKTDTTTSI